MAVPSKEHGAPHPLHHRSDWWPRAEKISRAMLDWSDVKMMGVFGRFGFFANTLLFATVPQHENALELWIRLSEKDAAELGKNKRASEHTHPVKGWMRLRVDSDDQVDEAVSWCKRGYEHALALTKEFRGVPVEKVPLSPAQPAHKIPHGPASGTVTVSLDLKGATPVGAMKSNMDVRELP